MYENFSLVRRLSQWGTLLSVKLFGTAVGEDAYGNRYFQERKAPLSGRARRWVLYAGEPEASKVPPEWHGWLHHRSDAPLAEDSDLHRAWQKTHQANLTGSPYTYLPPGHTLAGGVRAKATGDYEAWTPSKT